MQTLPRECCHLTSIPSNPAHPSNKKKGRGGGWRGCSTPKLTSNLRGLDQHTHSTLRIYPQEQSKQECRALQSGTTHWWMNDSPWTTTISRDSSAITPKPQTQNFKKRFTANPAVSVAVAATTMQRGKMIKRGASDHRQSWSSTASLKSGVWWSSRKKDKGAVRARTRTLPSDERPRSLCLRRTPRRRFVRALSFSFVRLSGSRIPYSWLAFIFNDGLPFLARLPSVVACFLRPH